MNIKQIIIVMHLLGLSLLATGTPLNLHYSSYIPQEQRRQLEQDVIFMRRFPWKDNVDRSLAKILQIPEVTPLNLEGWLSQRVRYIVDETYKLEFNDENFYLLREKVKSVVSATPWIPEMIADSREAAAVLTNGGVVEIAKDKGDSSGVFQTLANIGSQLYYYGIMGKVLFGMPIQGVGVVPVTSPQVGILQMGSGFFKALSGTFGEENPLSSPFYRLRRIRTLFHEARHGDGNTKAHSRSFLHEPCPEGHDYAGFYACDVAANGPYRIGSLIARAAIENCQQSGDCGVPQLEALKLLMADDIGRLIGPIDKAPTLDPTPEGIERQW
jgi:hypothetical protein